MTEWKPLPGYEGVYSISDNGQVMRTGNPGSGVRVGLMLRHRIDRNGYHSVMPCMNGQTKVVYIHQAVMIAFNGLPQQLGLEVNHINGIKADNYKDNLEWMTTLQNVRHSYTTGIHKRKLTPEEVINIREAYVNRGNSQQALADKYKVSQRMISLVVRKEVYLF